MQSKTKIIATTLTLVLVLSLALSLTANVLLYNSLPALAVQSLAFEDVGVIVEPSDNSELTAYSASDIATRVLTVRPDVELPDTLIDWSISFKDSTSSWASGKAVTDYATITPTADGALTATLAVRDVFGEQIIVTASLRGNSEIKASCTVDYRKRYKYSIEYLMPGVEQQAIILQNFGETTGTLSSGFYPRTFSFTQNQKFMNELLSNIYTDAEFIQFIRNNTDTCSEIDTLIHYRYERELFGPTNEFIDWLDYHISTLPNRDYKEFTVPVFNCINFCENTRHPNDSIYIGGFNTESTRTADRYYNELMLCRFLGLSPHHWEKYYDGYLGGLAADPQYFEISGDKYYFNIPASEYERQLNYAGITEKAISMFKRAFNSLIDRWLSQGIILSTADDVTWWRLGFESKPAQIDFDYIFVGEIGFFGDITGSVMLFGLNKFTVEV